MVDMQKTDFRQIDLNLLKLLDALIRERSVTKAGHRLGLSQPAASRALARLRRLLADRLVVRTAQGLELTPRAESLAEPVARMLEAAAAIVTPATFSPATASGRMTVAAIDHLTLMVMPGLILRLGQLAPGLDLEVPPSQGDNVELVAHGAADLALGVFEELPVAFYRRTLYVEDFVCVVRASHALVNEGMTIERFAAMSHLQVIITGRGQTQVDAALARIGMTRRVAMRVPHFLAAAALVADSDMILSLPRRLANRMASICPIAVLEMPFEVEPFDVTMIWHERRQDDRAHAWLRQQVVEAAQEAGLRWRGEPRRLL